MHDASAAPRPADLTESNPDRIVDLDVRDDLRNGREPFSRIMAAREELKPNGVLRLRTTMEPVPLYRVMARSGLAHRTERLGDDDWCVWFYPAVEAAFEAEPPSPVGAATDQEEPFEILDVRGLEPPRPMIATLEALRRLPRGRTLLQINARVPRFLLPELEARGFRYRIEGVEPETVRVTIRHAESAPR